MANLLLERNSGNLQKEGNIPAEATVFPPQYAHLGVRPDLVVKVATIRDHASYSLAYDSLWTTLCMQIDLPIQRGLLTSLRSQLPGSIQPQNAEGNYGPLPPRIPSGVRRERIMSYWQDLAEGSIYPVYINKRDQLRHDGYGLREVNTWVQPATESGDITDTAAWPMPFDEARKIFRWVDTPTLRKIAGGYLGGINRSHDSISPHLRDLQDQLRTNDQPGLMGYTTLLFMLNQARAYPQERILGHIQRLENHNTGKSKFEPPRPWPETIETLLYALEPYYAFQQKLSGTLKEWEKAHFGDDSLVASTLWKSAVNLRYSRLESVSPSQARRPLVQELINGNYSQARDLIEQLMADNPQILPGFVADRLQIEPEVLREILLEEQSREQAEKVNSETAPYISPERKSYTKALEEAAPFIGKEMVSADGTLTLTITARILEGHTRNGSPYKRTRFDVHTNDLIMLLGRDHNPIITPQAIPGLVEKFGFTFVDSEET